MLTSRSSSLKDIRGIRICRQANANWIEEFDERKDPLEELITGLQEHSKITIMEKIPTNGLCQMDMYL